ncbi:hydratase [Pigmentiphaga aceris]|uniref:Hydratase n=1 Tax=Pigmentiphaga aceris TaxID=1940612 RepID=A0A5C0B737_9BURK|nr:hydratase [Pigmentiphaga aceris]QEI08507.1 hydratase [Pigmentiphaga aceris]
MTDKTLDTRPETTFDPALPAARLANASRTGELLTDLPASERPPSFDEAYIAQSLMVAGLDDPQVGWKIAGASPAGLRGELPNPAVTGCLTQARVFPSGTVVTLPAGASATLETEVAVRFSRDVSPADEDFDAATMIDSAFVAIEVVCSRFVDRKAVSYPSFVADNAGFHAFIQGEAVAFSPDARFEDEAGIWKDDERLGGSLAGDKRTQPFLSLTFLFSELRRRGITVPKGAIVTTGTLSVPFDTSRPGYYEARLGAAKVGVSLVYSAD